MRAFLLCMRSSSNVCTSEITWRTISIYLKCMIMYSVAIKEKSTKKSDTRNSGEFYWRDSQFHYTDLLTYQWYEN